MTQDDPRLSTFAGGSPKGLTWPRIQTQPKDQYVFEAQTPRIGLVPWAALELLRLRTWPPLQRFFHDLRRSCHAARPEAIVECALQHMSS
jgi:hypothetical protein